MALAPLSARFQSLPCYPQSNWAPPVLIPEQVGSRPLWVSPVNYPVRVGVSPPATTPTGFYPTGFYPTGLPHRLSRGFEAFFSHTGALGCSVCLALQLFLLVYPQANVGLPAATSPAQSSSRLLTACPFHPGCPSLPLLSIWMNVSSVSPWLLDFHTV